MSFNLRSLKYFFGSKLFLVPSSRQKNGFHLSINSKRIECCLYCTINQVDSPTPQKKRYSDTSQYNLLGNSEGFLC